MGGRVKVVCDGLKAVSEFVEQWVGIIVLAGMLVLTGLVVVVFKLVEDQKTNSRSQLRNRVANVETWCGAINESRDYERTLVKTATQGSVTFTLPDLPCSQLERETELSTKRPKGSGRPSS